MTTLAFDQVVIVSAGTREVYTAEEFLVMPLSKRIQHILARNIEFFLDGTKIERSDALRNLRR